MAKLEKVLHKRWAALDDKTTWELPDWDPDDSDQGFLGWRLRYAPPCSKTDCVVSRADCMQAAAIVAAYSALVRAPQRRLIEVVRALKAAMKARGG